MPHQRVEKCESPRTGSATRAALAHAVPSRMTAVPRSGSPHLGSNLPPYVGRRCTCAMPHQCVEKPKVAKLPAPSRHRSPTLSHTVRGHGHTPAAVSRWSKSGHVDHSRHFRASLPTQEPHPHGGPLFLGCATSLSRTTSASTDAATSWVGSTHNGRAQPFTSPCGRRPSNSRVHHRRRQLLHRPQTASEAAGSAPCPSAAHALGLEHAPT